MIVPLVLILILGAQLSECCDTNRRQHGCRIQNKRCSCDDFGCNSEYRYETFEECNKALKGKRANNCNPNPCLHNGTCVQISQQPGYRCTCDGTGYFGARCHRICPKPGASPIGESLYPHECIVI